MTTRCITVAFVFMMATSTVGCSCSETGMQGDANPETDSSSSWSPPIPDLGEPGWRDSGDPYCAGLRDRAMVIDVWSYEGGVYAAVMDSAHVEGTSVSVVDIMFNGGTGWRDAFEPALDGIPYSMRSNCYSSLSGMPGGMLMAWGGSCRLAMFRGDVLDEAEFVAHNVFVVSDTLAYGCAREGLMSYDGTRCMRSSLSACPGYGLWADDGSVFSVGEYGIAHEFAGEEWIGHDTGVISTLKSVWAFGPSDVWVGSASDLLVRFDGTTWQPMDWPDSAHADDQGIEGMWGVDGTLFFHTSDQLVRWQDDRFSILTQ